MRQLMNDGWLFARLPSGSIFSDTEKAAFEPVDLPHDWLIWQEKDLYETADAWYRRDIELPENHDPVVMIRFDGVYMDCDVLLNGEVIYTHPYGYTAFDVSLTGSLKPGRNVLAVHIRHQSPNSRWYSGSGIYRDVCLVTLPEDHLIPDSLYMKETAESDHWMLAVSARTAGRDGKAFFCSLADPEGRTVAEAEGFSKAGEISTRLKVPDARLWSPEDPFLYKLTIRYGEETETRKIGLRSVSVDPEKGMSLNGIPVKLKGVCLHHDLGALGSAFHEKAARRQLKLMQDMGANAVRTSHNPPADKFLDLCDEMGILVIDEAFDMWENPKTAYDYARFFPQWHQHDVASWIRRDRCHACVIMWSIGNEIYDMHAGPRGEEITKELTELVRVHDPLQHAYVTFGCNYMPWEGGQHCAGHVDIVGYNYGEKLYDLHHSEHPSWVIYGSETASILSSRGIYHFPISQSIMSDADMQCSALGNSNTSWGADSLKKILADDLHHPFSLGQFLWSGIDYIGEPTPYHTRSCYFGQADTACFPKDSFYLIKSLWTDHKMIHIGVSWDWNGGQMIDVPVITNCFEAELILNGQPLGRKRNDEEGTETIPLVWKLPFTPGELTAKGYDEKGNLICTDQRYTPGDTDHFTLSCEEETLLSDGKDMVFVTVSAMDSDGHPVENARDRVKIHVSGGGRLIGTDNGNSSDTDGYKSDCRRLFSGKLLLMIASDGKQQDVYIRIEGSDGKSTSMLIPVTKVPIAPGVSCRMKAFERPFTDSSSVRRIDIQPCESTTLTKEHSECTFRYATVSGNDPDADIQWEVTNEAGIESPYVQLTHDSRTVTVHAYGDGLYYLCGLYRERGKCIFISQMEFAATGLGIPALNPYEYISAGLYDLHEGEIGCGNEKGIAFARGETSMIGFRQIDFGKTGSDTITADIFALNDDACSIELFTISRDGTEHRIDDLRYQKKSIWNVYQPETWKLSERLTGIRTLCFRMKEKVHMKGFSFEKQQSAWLYHEAGSADRIYGDSFCREGKAVNGIGNNVTLIWTGMEFDREGTVMLEIDGRTDLPVNTISIRIKNRKGEERNGIAEFSGKNGPEQRFPVRVPEGECSVSFVFLPGCSFDFYGYRIYRDENWTEMPE